MVVLPYANSSNRQEQPLGGFGYLNSDRNPSLHPYLKHVDREGSDKAAQTHLLVAFLESTIIPYELTRCEKTGLRGFQPGLTQTGLYNHTRWLEA